MSRITKNIAKDTAKKLLEKRIKLQNERKTTFWSWVASKYKATLPPEILSLPDNLKTFLFYTSSIHVRGVGIDYKMSNVYTNGSITFLQQYSKTPSVDLSNEDAVSFVQMWEEIDTERKKLLDDEFKLEQSLLALKTYKKVQEVFPEAYAALPEIEKYNLPTINVDVLKEMIK